jgi:hypothetical protein
MTNGTHDWTDDDFEGECTYECTWNSTCIDDFTWFDVCDVYDCINNCTEEYSCIVDWQDENYNGDYTYCEEFYDTFGNDTHNDTDDEDDECPEECSDPQDCPNLPDEWSWCQMTYCWNSCDGVVSPDCTAKWFDHRQMYQEDTCDNYHAAVDEFTGDDEDEDDDEE